MSFRFFIGAATSVIVLLSRSAIAAPVSYAIKQPAQLSGTLDVSASCTTSAGVIHLGSTFPLTLSLSLPDINATLQIRKDGGNWLPSGASLPGVNLGSILLGPAEATVDPAGLLSVSSAFQTASDSFTLTIDLDTGQAQFLRVAHVGIIGQGDETPCPVSGIVGYSATITYRFTGRFTVEPFVTVATASIPPADVGAEYNFCFSTNPPAPSRAGYVWQISFANAPPAGFLDGMEAFKARGCFDNIPEVNGSFPFEVIVTDSAGHVSPPAYFTLNVAATTQIKAAYARSANQFLEVCLKDSNPKSVDQGLAGIANALDCALAIKYARLAGDPPDSNFTSIADAVPFPFSLPTIAWPSGVTARLNDLLVAQAKIYGFAQATLTATERALGAQAAGDAFWYARQSQASAQFSELMAQTMAAYPSLAASFKAAYFSAGLPDIVFAPADVEAVLENLPDLPFTLVNRLLAAGLTADDIATLSRLLAVQPLPTAPISLFTLLDGKAAVFSAETSNLSAIAALKSAITDSRISRGLQDSLRMKVRVVEAAIRRGEFHEACGVLAAIKREELTRVGVHMRAGVADLIEEALDGVSSVICWPPVEDNHRRHDHREDDGRRDHREDDGHHDREEHDRSNHQ